jgi:cystathionine beta-lyase/cystathionine gamma-synthase
MTHAPVDEETLEAAGIHQNLVRLSVGVEDGEDLLEDVLAALEAASGAADDRPLAVAGG